MINPAIDSMTVLTPLDKFNSITDDLNDFLLTVSANSGEIVKSSHKPVIYDKEGIKFRVFKVSLFGKEYIGMVWTSKMLMQSYYEGLSYVNFKRVFDYWAHHFFDCDYNVYLQNSIVNDCDFKVDFEMDDFAFHQYLDSYRSVSGAKAFFAPPLDFMASRRKIGVQLVKRSTASIGAPFVKFYSKEEELLSRSSEFAALFLPYGRNPRLRRIEATVMNLDHFKSLKCLTRFNSLQMNALNVVLDYAPFAYDICAEMLDKHVSKHVVTGQKTKNIRGITPFKFFAFQMMHELMTEHSYTMANVLSLIDKMEGINKDSRSRLRKNMKDLYSYLFPKEAVKDLKITAKDAFYPN